MSAVAVALDAGRSRLPSAQLRRVGPVLVLLVLSLGIGLAAPSFWAWSNLMNIASAAAIPLIVGVGLTFVVISGGIDLSVEGVMGLSAVGTALLVKNQVNQNDIGWVAIVAVVVVGIVIGCLSAFVHVSWRVPPFMVTLGVWYGLLGLATLLITGRRPVITDEAVRVIATGRIGGVPDLFLVALGVLLFGYFLQRLTRFGRYTYAIGGDERIAVAAGIPIRRYKVLIFALAGGCSALAGCLSALRLATGQTEIGSGVLFTVISAVIVGGTAITGGVGGVLQTLVGVLVITVIGNGLVLLSIDPLLQTGVQGVVLLAAIALTLDRSKVSLLK